MTTRPLSANSQVRPLPSKSKGGGQKNKGTPNASLEQVTLNSQKEIKKLDLYVCGSCRKLDGLLSLKHGLLWLTVAHVNRLHDTAVPGQHLSLLSRRMLGRLRRRLKSLTLFTARRYV